MFSVNTREKAALRGILSTQQSHLGLTCAPSYLRALGTGLRVSTGFVWCRSLGSKTFSCRVLEILHAAFPIVIVGEIRPVLPSPHTSSFFSLSSFPPAWLVICIFSLVALTMLCFPFLFTFPDAGSRCAFIFNYPVDESVSILSLVTGAFSIPEIT